MHRQVTHKEKVSFLVEKDERQYNLSPHRFNDTNPPTKLCNKGD